MEFILISEDKLKVVLSKNDLAEFDMKADELDYSKTETKRVFWDIIGRAARSVGFNCDGSRILVQLYTCRDGGCEMFISRLCSYEEGFGVEETDMHCKKLRKNREGLLRRGVYGFETLEWLITVCRRLCEIGYSGNSSAYVGDDRRFYLILDGLNSLEYSPLDEYSFLCEYGDTENTEALTNFLSEHGKEICPSRAVETLSVL